MAIRPAPAGGGPWAAGVISAPQALGSALASGSLAAAAKATAVLLAALLIAVWLIRRVRTRRALARRVAFQLLPTNSFDPTVEDVLRFAMQLAETRPAVAWRVPRRALALRVRLTTGSDARLAYYVEGPRTASSLLRHQSYSQVEVRRIDPPAAAAAGTGDTTGPDAATPTAATPTAVPRSESTPVLGPGPVARPGPAARP